MILELTYCICNFLKERIGQNIKKVPRTVFSWQREHSIDNAYPDLSRFTANAEVFYHLDFLLLTANHALNTSGIQQEFHERVVLQVSYITKNQISFDN